MELTEKTIDKKGKLMNIENIELNKPYKYKQACELLGEPQTTGGNNRKYQLEKWSRYFDFTRQGHSIIFTAKKKVDIWYTGKGGSKKYDVLKPLLLDYLTQSKARGITTSRNYLFHELALIKDNFYNFSSAEFNTFAENEVPFEIQPYEVRYFKFTLNQKLKNILNSALKSLQKQDLIIYKSGYVVNRYTAASKITSSFSTKEEQQYIKTAKEQVIKQLEQSKQEKVNSFTIALNGEIKNFYDLINQWLLENYNFEILSFKYCINLVDDVNCTLSDTEKIQYSVDFRKNLENYFRKSADKKEKTAQEDEWGNFDSWYQNKEKTDCMIKYFL